MATRPAALQLDWQPALRSGPGYWLSSYWAMLRWQLASMRLYVPVMAAVQVLAGIGLVLGFGLFFPGPVPARSALFVSTGVTVINLYLIGLVLVPQLVGQQKLAKTYDFIQSIPVPRAVAFLAWWSVTLIVGAPAMVASLVTAAFRYHQAFALSLAIVPATILVSLTAIAIGYALGNAVSQPMVSNVMTQVLNIFAIGFAPVCFPPEQLPGWLQALNQVLPFESMAIVMRTALTSGGTENILRAYAVLGIWTLACLSVAAWSVVRRG